MDKIWFLSPDGTLSRQAVLEDIVQLMHSKGEEFWNSHLDTGFASLKYFRDREEIAWLVFTKKDGYGFHMKFTEFPYQRSKKHNYVSVHGNDYEDMVEVNLSESPMWVPRAFFIDAQKAEQVVR